MCGRYNLTDPAGIPQRFQLRGSSEVRIEPRFNVAPTQTLPIVVDTLDGPLKDTIAVRHTGSTSRIRGQQSDSWLFVTCRTSDFCRRQAAEN